MYLSKSQCQLALEEIDNSKALSEELTNILTLFGGGVIDRDQLGLHIEILLDNAYDRYLDRGREEDVDSLVDAQLHGEAS